VCVWGWVGELGYCYLVHEGSERFMYT
jgi:hypothetical protein